MRASLVQVRDAALEAVDSARGQAAGLVDEGSGQLVDVLDSGAKRLSADIERWAQVAPVVSLEVAEHKRRRRWPTAVLIVAVGALTIVIVRRFISSVDQGRTSGAFDASNAELTGNGSTTDQRDRSPQFQVMPSAAGGWDVIGPGDAASRSHHDTQAAGIEQAQQLAERSGGQIIIYGVDGKIRDTRTVRPA